MKDIKLIENIGGDGVAIASALHYNLLPNIFDYKVKNKFFSRKNLNEDIGNYEWVLNGYGDDRTSMVPILSLKEIKKNILTGRNQ